MATKPRANQGLMATWANWMASHPGAREGIVVVALYMTYTLSRTLADAQFKPALDRARALLTFEVDWHLDWEKWTNTLFVTNEALGLASAYWYASTHYVVTAGVMIWLYATHRRTYLRARQGLVLATLIALACYLTIPMAPPRFMAGYVDVMLLHSGAGWWGANASAPQGLGGLTNELAAFPSMHAGWAVWVALAVFATAAPLWAKGLSIAYASITCFVVIGTGNHWVLDVVAGVAVTLIAWRITGHLQGVFSSNEEIPDHAISEQPPSVGQHDSVSIRDHKSISD